MNRSNNTSKTAIRLRAARRWTAVFVLASHLCLAMPGPAHNASGERLMGVPADQGGVGPMTAEKIRSTDTWMDSPSSRLGSWHGNTRHSPEAVARVYSGNGTVDPAALNKARLHKIEDIAHNTRPVDGWYPDPHLKKEAEEILRFVHENHRLPGKLPRWVDEPGPLLRPATTPAGDMAAAARRTGARLADDAALAADDAASVLVRTARGVQRVAVPLAVAVQLGMALREVYATEADFAAGRITPIERSRRHIRTSAELAGGSAGAWAGGALGSVAGPPGTVVGVIVGSVAGDWLAGKLNDAAWELYAREAEARDRIRFAATIHILQTSGEIVLTLDDYRELGILPH